MAFILGILGTLVAGLLIALNVYVAVRSPGRLRRLSRVFLSGLHRRAEAVEFHAPAPAPQKGAKGPPWHVRVYKTRLGKGACLASILFLGSWIFGWVPPSYTVGFMAHLVVSWVYGLAGAGVAFLLFWSLEAAFRMSRAEIFAAKTGLARVWLASTTRRQGRLLDTLRSVFAEAPRIEFLDFTGYELIAKGHSEGRSDDPGPLARILARFPEKEVRILLFNPCGREIDPDRKHTTVLQSQLTAMDLSREAFESRLRATIDRIDQLNRDRKHPIEVRLYSEKPSFRVLVAGEVAFLGAIDPRDSAGEIPLYEARRQSQGPSLHAAMRSHLLRVWGDSLPVNMEAASTVS
jgi:hypothetical protein